MIICITMLVMLLFCALERDQEENMIIAHKVDGSWMVTFSN